MAPPSEISNRGGHQSKRRPPTPPNWRR